MGTTVAFEPLGESIGAEVSGVDAHSLIDPAVAARCLAELERYGVLVFRRLHLDDAAQVAFTRLLGDPVIPPRASGPHPEIFVVTLDPAQNRAAEYLKGTFFWHIDGSTDDVPTRCSLLSARSIAAEGGDTEFAGTYAAYEALPAAEQEQLSRLRVVHALEFSQRLVVPNPTDAELASWRRLPHQEHPLVWRHASGRRSLVPGAPAGCVVGTSDAEGRALLDRLLAWSTQPRFVYRHAWEVGDLVIWDNRGTMHRALPYSPSSNRTMHRTTIVGDEAIA
jgi:alpha-ketoglutarate-dependent taurine dioxygenase